MLARSAPARDRLRRARRASALLILALLAAVPLAAQEGPSEADQRAILTVTINDVPKGEMVVVLRSKDVLVSVSSLAQAGLTFRGQREIIDGEAFVSLASLAPAVVFKMDDRALTLSIMAQPDLLPATRLNLTNNRPAGLTYGRATSAFLNYGVNWWQTTGYDGSLEVGGHLAGALALSTFTYTAATGPLRGQTAVSLDERGALRRWTVGDTFIPSRLLGSSLYMAGVRVSRDFSLDPYFIRYPQLALSGSVLTPSTMEVYVNDRLVSRQQIAPGKFELANLPLPAGSGQARVVIRDAFGREQQMATPFYLTTTALARGLSEYDYAFGVQRSHPTVENWSYQRPSFVGSHRYGLTDTMTPGFRVEADSSRFSGGPTFNARLPIGELEVTGAVSRDPSANGGALGVGYAFIGHPFSIAVSGRAMTRGYSTLALDPGDDRARLDASVYGSVQLSSRMNLSVQQSYRDSYLAGATARTGLLTSWRLTRRSNVFVEIGRTRAAGTTTREGSVGVSIFLWDGTTANASVANASGGVAGSMDVQRSLPYGTGYGYRMQQTSGPGGYTSGALQYQSRFGRYEVGQDFLNGSTRAHVAIAGGIATIGGSLPYLTRPLSESFALVRVPGVPGVRAYAENQEVGRTNGRGDLLIPNLLAYYGNRLSIADQDVPLDRELRDTAKVIAPPYRGGAMVVFDSVRIQAATGQFVFVTEDPEPVVPAYGDLRVTVGAKDYLSPLGGGGEFYLENVPPGTHVAIVRYGDLTCTMSLRIPRSNSQFISLGTHYCVVDGRQP